MIIVLDTPFYNFCYDN